MSSWSALGLSATEEQVLRCYMHRRDDDADEASKRLGLSREEFDEATRRLVTRRLLHAGTDGMISPVSPVNAAQVLLASAWQDLGERFADLTRIGGSVPSLVEEMGLSPEFSSGVEHISDLPQLRDRMADITFFSRVEVAAVWTEPTMSDVTIERARPQDMRLLRRGVKVRTLITAQAAIDDVASGYFSDLVDAGAEVRVVPEASERMILCDKQIGVIPKDPDNHSLGALIVHEPGLVKSLMRLYDHLWEGALPLHVSSAKDEDKLSTLNVRVLQTLCHATKDEAAARELGVSVRTFRRYVADVVEVLGARNRIDAVLRAREQGLI